MNPLTPGVLPRPSRHPRSRWSLCVAALLPLLSPAQVIWDNGNGNNRWGTANNWNPNAVPGAASNVQFNATDDNATVSNIQLRANVSANSLTFNNVDDSFSLINGTGSRTLTLTSGDITRTAGSSNTQSLTFTTLALGGDAAMNIAGSGSLTIASAIIDSGGARSLTKSGAGTLILSGANTFSGDTTVSAGTLTLQSASALGAGSTLTLAGGTLRLNTATTTVTTLNVTGNSIIDFATAATFNVTNLTIGAGVSLTIQNWTNMSDFFFASNWTGAIADTTGASPMNQVTFTGFAANDTKWLGYDDQITPVPEPATYGAWLLGGLAAFFFWRRRARA
jgi:MYXO-CTERM domain-containing protein